MACQQNKKKRPKQSGLNITKTWLYDTATVNEAETFYIRGRFRVLVVFTGLKHTFFFDNLIELELKILQLGRIRIGGRFGLQSLDLVQFSLKHSFVQIV